MKKTLLLTLLLLCSFSAKAGFASGNDLHKWLNTPGDTIMAVSYITGVADAQYRVQHCTPTTVTVTQMADMVKDLLNDNPIVRHMEAHRLVTATLKAAWPCKPASSKPDL